MKEITIDTILQLTNMLIHLFKVLKSNSRLVVDTFFSKVPYFLVGYYEPLFIVKSGQGGGC